MKAPFLWMLLMAMAATACHGAETLGYRFVTEPNISTPVLRCPVLAQAPAATPFAATGDELHDLTALVRAERIPLAGGWVLWNQTRKMLVVRGALVDQWRIAEMFGFYRQSLHSKVTIEWLRAKDPTAVPTEPVFAAVGMLMNSGQKGEASVKLEKPDGQWSFSAAVEANNVPDDGVFGIPISAKWKGPGVGGVQHGSVRTSVAVVDGRQLPLASWYASGRGDAWWMRLNVEVLLADGSCWRDARLRQVGESAQAWPTFTPAAPYGTLPQVPGWQMGAPRTSIDMLKTMVLGPNARDTDPAATTSVAEEYPKFDLPEAVIPDDLKDFAAPPMLDLRHVPFMSAVAPRDDVFFAYDPISHRVVFGCKNRDVFDHIEQFFFSCVDDFAQNFKYETWLFDAAVPTAPVSRTSITTLVGHKSVIEWRGRKHRPLITLETELSDDGNEEIGARNDFRCRIKAQSDTGLEWHVNSATQLVRGVPLLTDALKLPDGRTIRQGQRASVSQVRAE